MALPVFRRSGTLGATIRRGNGAKRARGREGVAPSRWHDRTLGQVNRTAVPLALTISMERPSLPRCS
jgi:hypothetical protein